MKDIETAEFVYCNADLTEGITQCVRAGFWTVESENGLEDGFEERVPSVGCANDSDGGYRHRFGGIDVNEFALALSCLLKLPSDLFVDCIFMFLESAWV